jgi:ABC-type multidrug transport system fused ATPase/permease subunit
MKNNKNAIRYVPQNVQLIPTTLRNNLLWPGAFDANLDNHLVNCLKLAELETFLESLPKGLDTVISPNGANLSGGQRQRIGIARSLVANPRILFLDEATSSLDAKTEAEISHKIFSKLVNVTRVVIAHRISTIQSADRIIYLDEGKIVGQGSFSELINQVPAFRVAANASLEK